MRKGKDVLNNYGTECGTRGVTEKERKGKRILQIIKECRNRNENEKKEKKNKAGRHKSRAPSNQRRTDGPTDGPTDQ